MWRDFAEMDEYVVIVDAIAKRYGLTPGEVIRMSAEDFGVALVCLRAHIDSIGELASAAESQGGIGGMVVGLVAMHARLVS